MKTNSGFSKLRFLLIFIACLFLCDLSNAQKIGQIKKKAQENKSKKSSSNSNSSSKSRSKSRSRSSSGSSSDSYDNGDGITDFFNGLSALFDLLTPKRTPEERAALQAERQARRAARQQEWELKRAERQLARQQLRAEGKLNSLYEFNIGLQYGGVPGLYQSYRPRMRLRMGVVSTDVHYGILSEERIGGKDIYETLDWQILQINVINTPELSWRFGAGIMREQFTDSAFPEFLTGVDYYFARRRARLSPEIRMTYDFHPESEIKPRQEINAELSYAVINQEKFKMHLGINALYAKYYEEVDIWTLGAGVRLNIY